MKAERLRNKPGKQDFHYDMEENFEPVTENQNQNQTKQQELSEKQIQVLRSYVNLLKLQNKQSEIRQEQYNTAVLFWMKTYKN